jgi:hypothetical protein
MKENKDLQVERVIDIVTSCVNIADFIDDLRDTPYFANNLKQRSNSFQKLLFKTVEKYCQTAEDKETRIQLADNIDARNSHLKLFSMLSMEQRADVTHYIDQLLHNEPTDEVITEIEEVDAKTEEKASNPLDDILKQATKGLVVTKSETVKVTPQVLDSIPMDKSITDETKRVSKFRADVVATAKAMLGEGNWKFNKLTPIGENVNVEFILED